MMQDYFSKMEGTALPNEYAKAAQELYLALGAKVPQEAHKVSIEWLTNALKGENSITDKINYITMIGGLLQGSRKLFSCTSSIQSSLRRESTTCRYGHGTADDTRQT